MIHTLNTYSLVKKRLHHSWCLCYKHGYFLKRTHGSAQGLFMVVATSHHLWPVGACTALSTQVAKGGMDDQKPSFLQIRSSPSKTNMQQGGVTRIISPDNAVSQLVIPPSLSPTVEVFRESPCTPGQEPPGKTTPTEIFRREGILCSKCYSLPP